MSHEAPPQGTKCTACGCCNAGIYVDAGLSRVAICMACNLGEVCAPRRRRAMTAAHNEEHSLLGIGSAITESPTEPQTQPEPEPTTVLEPLGETTMADLVCKGGCGTTLPASNKSGFAWGHKSSCPGYPPPRTLEAEPEEFAEPEVVMNLTEAQLERIWQSLPIEEKALAIATALTAERQ